MKIEEAYRQTSTERLEFGNDKRKLNKEYEFNEQPEERVIKKKKPSKLNDNKVKKQYFVDTYKNYE